jgi:hypothetical protein
MIRPLVIDGGCAQRTQFRISAVSVADWKHPFVIAAARQAGLETPN